MIYCWSCGKELEELPSGILPFRATCDHCMAWLHCCRNCEHYKPGLPNDCAIPGTDYIADREAVNFCEEFTLLGKAPPKKAQPKDVSKQLFGEEDDINELKKFDDLFND